VRIVPESDSLLRWLVVPFLAVAAALVAVALWSPSLLLRLAHCPWRSLTGIPCPTCGGTEAAVHLAGGHWSAAWRANPLAPLLVILVVLWAGWSLAAAFLPALRLQVELTPAERKAARIGTALLIVGLWTRQILVG